MPPVVRTCLEHVATIRVGEDRILSSGGTRRYLSCGHGRPLLFQLPVCHTPGGLVHDFAHGASISLVPVDEAGRRAVDGLRSTCSRSALAGGLPDSARIPVGLGKVDATAARTGDVRIFESEHSPSDGIAIVPGDTVTAIVSVDHLWTSASRRSCGVCLRLVQVLLHTDRARYTSPMFLPTLPPRSPPPPPPPPPPPAIRNPPAKKKPSPPAAATRGFRPSAIDIVNALNSLRRTNKDSAFFLRELSTNSI